MGNGIYTLTTDINETVWFVFADGLTSNWNDFNANYRYGPNGNSSQTVSPSVTYSTQKANNNHSYMFRDAHGEYTFTFDLNRLEFKVEEYSEPLTPDPFSISAGDVNGDGEINIADINTLIDILLGGKADYDTHHRADVNYDAEVNIADVNVLIDYLLGGDLPERQGRL